MIRISLLLSSLLLTSSIASAYYNLLTTGDLVQTGKIQGLAYTELVFNRYSGANVNLRASTGITDELQGDVELGIGKFDVSLGAYLKWVPIPDYQKQPAVGVRGGVHYIKMNDFSQTSVIAMPFVSKAYTIDYGRISPYLGLPFGINSNSTNSTFSMRLAVGGELTNPKWNNNFHFLSELGVDLAKSFTSLSLAVSYDF